MKRKLVCALLASMLPLAANAEFRLGKYRELSASPDVKEHLSDYVTGLGRGIFWANVTLHAQKKERLFCPPPELALDEAIIQSLLRQEIDSPKATYQNDTPIELIMVKAFIRHFPCKA